MNQMTEMFKKKDVMSVGGYQHWYCNEDYFLWIRMALSGYKFHNVEKNLLTLELVRKCINVEEVWSISRVKHVYRSICLIIMRLAGWVFD